MDGLDEFFTRAVRGLISDLESALTFWRDTGNSSEVRRHCHSIKGSGGSFGFPLISVLAAAAEEAPDDGLEEAVEMLMAELASVATTPARKHVLVVDDDSLIAGLLERRLSGPERRVTSTPDLETARKALEREHFDLIVLDLLLPDGDGRSLLDELGGSTENAGVPVVVLSASEATELQADCLSRGAEAFVTKPFDPDAFSHLIGTMLAEATGSMAERSSFVDAYDRLTESFERITVASILTETHGPGGKKSESPDPVTLDDVARVIRNLVTPETVIAQWGRAELALVTTADAEALIETLDRARLRMRTQQHPTVMGAIPSFSAGVITDTSDRGLVGLMARARRMAVKAHEFGGDRVNTPGRSVASSQVLLAEDDPLTAALVIHRLEREGFVVDHVSNGTDAAESFDRDSYDLVVLDIQMPGFDGFEVLEHIRETTGKRVPVVMLTAVGTERDVVRGFELGADDYILKPFSPAELTVRLKRFMTSEA